MLALNTNPMILALDTNPMILALNQNPMILTLITNQNLIFPQLAYSNYFTNKEQITKIPNELYFSHFTSS